MPNAETSQISKRRHADTGAIAIWVFAIVEAIGIAFVLWTY